MNLRMLCIATLVLLTLGQAAQARGVVTGRENHGRDARATSSKDRVVAEVARLGGKVELDETLPGKPSHLCIINYERRRGFHYCLMVFTFLLAVIHWYDYLAGHLGWMSPLYNSVPFLVLLIMALFSRSPSTA